MPDDIQPYDIIILRCCRDWPCHVGEAIGMKGRCGICRETPAIIWEKYPESMYARNLSGQGTHP